jgi:choline-glycine betaine transporter
MTTALLIGAWFCCCVSAWCEVTSPAPKKPEAVFASWARLGISMVLAIGIALGLLFKANP